MTKKSAEILDHEREETKYRHELREEMRNEFSKSFAMIDEVKDDVSDLKRDMAVANKSLTDMDSMLKRLLLKMDEFPGKFVTKEEHQTNEKRIEKLEEKQEKINYKIAYWSGIAVVVAFLVEKVWK